MSMRFGVMLLLAGSALGCRSEESAGPMAVDNDAATYGNSRIVVQNSTELIAALTPDNAGRRVLLRAGTYPIDVPLVVPDGMTLEGEGRMRYGSDGLPAGFAAGSEATLVMTANVPGNLLTLNDDVTIRRLEIVDLPGRAGNAIGVVSRNPGDQLSAIVAESKILNQTSHGVVPDGPTGCGLAVTTRNPALGADPPPHEGASLTVQLVSSLIRSPAAGVGCGVFAFNFAANGRVSVTLTNNVVGGGIIANGGVSRTNAVHDASTRIQSVRNLYRDDTPDACATGTVGWNLTGGSGPPAPLPVMETARNSLRVQSIGDRLTGFATGLLGTGGRRFFPAPTAGSTTGNSLTLDLIATRISTPACGRADFILAGVQVSSPTLVPGDGNTVRSTFLGVTGSGARGNVYADVLAPGGPPAPEYQGSGNRLEFAGTRNAFTRTNWRIEPLPGAEFFKAGVP